MVRCPFRFGDATKGLGRCLMWRERAMCAQGKGTGQQRCRPPPEGATSQRCCSGGPAPVARRQRARTTLDWLLGAGGSWVQGYPTNTVHSYIEWDWIPEWQHHMRDHRQLRFAPILLRHPPSVSFTAELVIHRCLSWKVLGEHVY